jgi:hypothetical protein
VATLRRWWQQQGKAMYPEAERLLVCADAGGSNGYRVRLWKTELARFAAEMGLAVTVCHFPPGTSKWNKVEHRLFSHISTNWRGRPLVSHEVVVELIAATRTRSGLRVQAGLDRGATRWASRSPTGNWPRCRCAATAGTGNGTIPSSPPPHRQHACVYHAFT